MNTRYTFIAAVLLAAGVIAGFLFFGSEVRKNENIGAVNGAGEGTVYIDSLELIERDVFPVEVEAVVRGNLADACTSISQVTAERINNTFTIDITAERPTDAMCAQVLTPFEERIDLNVFALPAGTYTVVAGDMTRQITLDEDNILEDKG